MEADQYNLNDIKQIVVYSKKLFAYAKNESSPEFYRKISIAALNYLVDEWDIIPDDTPFMGYKDDLAILSYALFSILINMHYKITNDFKIDENLKKALKDNILNAPKVVAEHLNIDSIEKFGEKASSEDVIIAAESKIAEFEEILSNIS